MLKRTVPLLVAVLILSACVTVPPPNPNNPIRTLAILPLVDDGDEPAATAYLRNSTADSLKYFHYIVQPISETDQLLRERLNITESKQLAQFRAQQIGEALHVDGVIYGILDDFVPYEMVPLQYKEKRAKLRLSLVRVSDGMQVWGNGAGVIRRLAFGQRSDFKRLAASGRTQGDLLNELEKSNFTARVKSNALPGNLDAVFAPWFVLTIHDNTDETGVVSALVEASIGKGFDYTQTGYEEVGRHLLFVIFLPDQNVFAKGKHEADHKFLQNMPRLPTGPVLKE